jgi:hypothetical protein
MRILSDRATRFAALALTMSFASALGAQGFSYDITSTSTHADRKTGRDTTVTVMNAHGQFEKGMSRLDVTQSMARGGVMGMGTYIITNGTTHTTTFVDPAKKQYMEFDVAELTKEAGELTQALGGMMKIEVTDVHASMESLGAGEKLEGYSTLKYRLTTNYTMNMSIMGHDSHTPTHTVADIWIAPDLDPIMNPQGRPDLSKVVTATGMMAPLTTAIIKAYANVKPGLMLKRVSTSTSGEGDKVRTSSMTTVVSNVKKGSIPASVFEVPAGYTKVEMPKAPAPPQ